MPVQQALENAWRHRERANPAAFRPWLTRIVINECISQLRRRKNAQTSKWVDQLACQSPPPDIALADALSRLPDKLRTPLLLHYMEGFSLEEIAKALGVPMTTVRNRLYRGRNALRDALTEGERDASCAKEMI